jgi:hypothetical protein
MSQLIGSLTHKDADGDEKVGMKVKLFFDMPFVTLMPFTL